MFLVFTRIMYPVFTRIMCLVFTRIPGENCCVHVTSLGALLILVCRGFVTGMTKHSAAVLTPSLPQPVKCPA